jgi:two-component system KDP operon response regulator KdpE
MMKPTLLIADGDAELCDLYQRFMAARGYEVETASDGLACLAMLRQSMPTVIVLDQDLRWGGGSGVLAWLREEKAAPGVAVILTTTSWSPVNASAVVDPPVVKCLPKPFTLSVLLESVHSAVAQGEATTLREAARKAGKIPALSEPFLG